MTINLPSLNYQKAQTILDLNKGLMSPEASDDLKLHAAKELAELLTAFCDARMVAIWSKTAPHLSRMEWVEYVVMNKKMFPNEDLFETTYTGMMDDNIITSLRGED